VRFSHGPKLVSIPRREKQIGEVPYRDPEKPGDSSVGRGFIPSRKVLMCAFAQRADAVLGQVFDHNLVYWRFISGSHFVEKTAVARFVPWCEIQRGQAVRPQVELPDRSPSERRILLDQRQADHDRQIQVNEDLVAGIVKGAHDFE
jgi:hypothetical protein